MLLQNNYEFFTSKCIFPPKYSLSKCKNGEKCIQCPYQPPDGNIIIPYNKEKCCRYKCHMGNKQGQPYYCNYNGTCIVRYGSQRNCGVNMMNTLPKKSFDTLEMCLRDVNPYRNYNERECLNKEGAGWCTDYRGKGLCIPGTPEGPIDMRKYFMCYVNQFNNNKNSWKYYN